MPISAEESLQAALQIAYGTGAMKEEDRREQARQWRIDLDLRAERPRTAESLQRMAAASGIRVVRQKESHVRRPRKGRTRPRN